MSAYGVVMRVAISQRCNTCVDDGARGIEVGITNAEHEHVLTTRLCLPCFKMNFPT